MNAKADICELCEQTGLTHEKFAANLGFESELWRAADAHRSNMDAAEYKHIALGLFFIKRDNHSLPRTAKNRWTYMIEK